MEKINKMLWAIDSHTDFYINMSKDMLNQLNASYL